MRLLLDTNVVLDVLLERQPFVQHSKQLWQAVDEGRLRDIAYSSASLTIFTPAMAVQASSSTGE